MNPLSDIEITSSPDEPVIKQLASGRWIKLYNSDAGFYNNLLDKPADMRIELMELTEIDMEKYITARKQLAVEAMTLAFRSKWVDGVEHERIDFSDYNDIRFDLPFMQGQKPTAILKGFKSGKYSLSHVPAVFNYFLNPQECQPASPNAAKAAEMMRAYLNIR